MYACTGCSGGAPCSLWHDRRSSGCSTGFNCIFGIPPDAAWVLQHELHKPRGWKDGKRGALVWLPAMWSGKCHLFLNWECCRDACNVVKEVLLRFLVHLRPKSGWHEDPRNFRSRFIACVCVCLSLIFNMCQFYSCIVY
jgi:hypothetical protein